MRKSIIVVTITLIVAMFPVAAQSSTNFGAGGTFGYPFEGAIATYDITDIWDVQLGFGYFFGNVNVKNTSYPLSVAGIAIDLATNFSVYQFEIDSKNKIDLTVGADVILGFPLNYSNAHFMFNLAIMAVPGASYQIPDFPMSVFLRIPLGVNILMISEGGGTHFGFAGGAQLGAIYHI